jgi:hypothetical protein
MAGLWHIGLRTCYEAHSVEDNERNVEEEYVCIGLRGDGADSGGRVGVAELSGPGTGHHSSEYSGDNVDDDQLVR